MWSSRQDYWQEAYVMLFICLGVHYIWETVMAFLCFETAIFNVNRTESDGSLQHTRLHRPQRSFYLTQYRSCWFTAAVICELVCVIVCILRIRTNPFKHQSHKFNDWCSGSPASPVFWERNVTYPQSLSDTCRLGWCWVRLAAGQTWPPGHKQPQITLWRH